MTDTEFATAGVRPLLRGVLHEVGFAIAIVVGVLVVIESDGVRRSVAAAGIAYTLGGIVYARRKPDPLPAVFGYHELFHALTLVALALQYVAITFFVVRAA